MKQSMKPARRDAVSRFCNGAVTACVALLAIGGSVTCADDGGGRTGPGSGGTSATPRDAGAAGLAGSGGAGTAGARDAGGSGASAGGAGRDASDTDANLGGAGGSTAGAGGQGGRGGSAGAAGKGGSAGTADGGTSGRAGSGGMAGGSGDAGRDGAAGAGGAAGTGGAAGAAGSDGGSSCPDLGGGPLSPTTQHLDIGVHDPTMIWNGTRYYLFGTSNTLEIRSSTNMQQWSRVGNIFSAIPAWVTTALGEDPGNLWAPDVSYFNCEFHVYYSGSTFGSNLSVIGLATSPTLDSSSPSYVWTDRGLVVQSVRSNDYNAIDPNVSFDETGAPWLSFGSFWNGIRMRKLDPVTGKPSTSDPTLYSLASRNGGAIEAPSIISRNGYYYLFVSFDTCCQGANSTYRTMVGRATRITGPYTNKAGTDMMAGAAEQLLATSGRYIGPGGGAAFRNGSGHVYAYHYYDGNGNGAPKLQVRPIDWGSDDWPTLGDPIFP
jgi:arabinan endo-1,5-alpha-L-arabinosidase